MESVAPKTLEDDVYFIAQERLPGSKHWQAVQDLAAARFAQHGFEVELHDYGTGVNVIGTLKGQGQPDEIVLVSAHYDHIRGCMGADDDASGSAAVLEMARVLSSEKYKRTLVVALFDEEEAGLRGSNAYAERVAQENKQIAVMIALDPIGYASSEPHSQEMPDEMRFIYPDLWAELEAREFRADWIGLIGDAATQSFADSFATYAEKISLPEGAIILSEAEKDTIGLFLGRADHAAFWNQGFPAVLIGNTADYRNPYYHCIEGQDAPETLDYIFLAKVTRAAVGASAETLGVLE